MIVRDESKVITRCLASVLDIIDYWVIVDTGSIDGTQQIIKDFMAEKKIPGELHERPWKNFGHNRNEALILAKNKADYIFFIDADNFYSYDSNFKLPNLDKDFYYTTLVDAGTKYPRISLIKNDMDREWKGVLHEAVCCDNATNFSTLENVNQIVRMDGARSKDPKKYEKDAAVFEEALKDEPDNARYVFYLAQSYRDAGNNQKALENYEKRAKMGGWDEEVFYSLLRVGNLQEDLDMPFDTVMASYKAAFQFRKSRVEPLYHMMKLFEREGNFNSGYLIGKIAQTIPPSKDLLFVQNWIYEYGMPLELSVCAYWIGKYEECQEISVNLLKKDLPENIKEITENNLAFANDKLLDKAIDSIVQTQPTLVGVN
jgi:glycosyltransferase involved in cell wall biosynthesis